MPATLSSAGPFAALVGLVGIGAALVVLARRIAHTLTAALQATGIAILAFFVLSPRAFVNYYWLAGVALTLAVLLYFAERPRTGTIST